jgi:hypothetical protein
MGVSNKLLKVHEPTLAFQVKNQRAFVSSVDLPMNWQAAFTPAPQVIAFIASLYLDYISAKIGQICCEHVASHEARKVQNPNSREWPLRSWVKLNHRIWLRTMRKEM